MISLDKIFGEKIEGLEYRPRKAVYAIIFNDTKEKVVTLQTPDGCHWLPGGGIEGDESQVETIFRYDWWILWSNN